MSSVSTLSSAAGSITPWGAIIGGSASVINNLVDNLFGSSQAKKAEAYKQALSTLNTQQQENLNYAMLQAKTDTERMQILTGAVASINQTAISSNSTSKNQTLLIALGAVVVLVAAVYFLNRL